MPLHSSIKMNYPCEMINISPVNPLISKCQIKVCYVSDKPNRNGSIITFHDSLKSIDTLREILPMALEWLKSEGYQFEIFEQLLARDILYIMSDVLSSISKKMG